LDTITHIALGACAGEIIAGKQLGKKALLIGAFANTIPDFDTLSSLWMTTDKSLLAHRGFTHSFLFVILTTIILAFAFQRWGKRKDLSFQFWLCFLGIELILHLFIDAFNAYGTGWFEPFSHYRVSFHTIFVADPFYSSWLFIATIILVIIKKDNPTRRQWAKFGLGVSTLYFTYCIFNKIKVETEIKNILEKQHVVYDKHFTTPTPLNNWLWYIVAGNDSGFYMGYYSAFDRKNKIDLHYFPKNNSLLVPVLHQEDVQHLLRFSKGFYTVENRNDTLVFNDLRFGQMVGWYDPEEKFVFHYFLQPEKDNKFVVQRGRFAKWNARSIQALMKRIAGN
jgi:inner membrane protein